MLIEINTNDINIHNIIPREKTVIVQCLPGLIPGTNRLSNYLSCVVNDKGRISYFVAERKPILNTTFLKK